MQSIHNDKPAFVKTDLPSFHNCRGNNRHTIDVKIDPDNKGSLYTMQSYTSQEIEDLFTFTTKTPKPNKPKKTPKPNSSVYVIVCKETRCLYVGSGIFTGNVTNDGTSDKSPNKCNRIAYHKSRLSKGDHPCHAMMADYLLYPESFIFKILEIVPTNEARAREQLMMMKVIELGQYKLFNTNKSYRF